MLKNFPILQELLSAGSFGIFIFVFPIFFMIGMKLKRKNYLPVMISITVYIACEAVSVVRREPNYLRDLVLLCVGTVSIGSFFGFALSGIVNRFR